MKPVIDDPVCFDDNQLLNDSLTKVWKALCKDLHQDTQIKDNTSMPLTVSDFPLITQGNLIYGKTQSSPVLTAMDTSTAELVTMFLNERHLIQDIFHKEGNQPLAIVFNESGMAFSRTT